MAYRALSLRAPCIRISTLSNRGSSLLQALAANHPSRNGLSPPSRLFSTSTQLQTIEYIKDAVTIVGGGLGALVSAATLWKLIRFLVNRGPTQSFIRLPPKPSHVIQPRTEEVRRLFEKFNDVKTNKSGNVVKTVYITGSPASGKTQLARQFGEQFFAINKRKNKKLFVGTLSADNRSNFLGEYLKIAVGVGCVNPQLEALIGSGQLDELQSLKMLSNHVEKELRERPEWLLIIDGLSFDEGLVKELRPFWPQPNDENWGKGYVLVTTQGPSIDMLDLKSGMSEKDALELLTKVSGCSNKEGAVKVVNSLDRCPLSVASAGIYIRDERLRKATYGFNDYMETVVGHGAQDRSEKALLEKGQHPYPHTRKQAVSMAAEQMVSNNPTLRKVFLLLAACAQAPVPLSLVARVLGVQPDSREMEDVCSCPLLSAGLGDSETVSVHQVTRSVFKDLFLQDISTSAVSEQKNGITHITDCVCQEFDNVCNDISSSDSVTPFQMMRLLIPHIESLLQINSDFLHDASHEVNLRFALGQSCQSMGRYMEAKEVLEKAMMVCNKEGIRETREGAGIAAGLGSIYGRLGMLKESEHILKEALGTFTKLYGEESVEVAEVLILLGGTYYIYHQLQRSWECYEHALEINEKLCGNKHTSVATVLNNLGNLWNEEGDKAKAISHYQEALAIQEEISGPNHLKVATTLSNLGCLLGGEHGINLLERALEIYKSVCEDHPEVASTLCILGGLYHFLGDLQKAKKMIQDALFVLQNIHNPPLLASVQHCLGLVLLELEEFEEAQKHFQSSFATHKALYGVKDIRTRMAHLRVAMAARLAGNLHHAKEILETAEDSWLVSDTLWLTELGEVYLDLGYLTQTLQVHHRALDIVKEWDSVKPNLQIAFRRAALAKALWESGEVRSGLEMMQQALKENEQSTDMVSKDDSVKLENLNTEHVLMLVTMSQMLQDTENLKEARAHLDNALDYLSKSSFPHNLVKAKTIYTRGTLFNKLAAKTTTTINPVAAIRTWYYRYRARKLMNTALDIMRKACDNHPNTATILAAIGRLELNSGDLHSAKHHLEEALDIQTTCCGPVHPNTALYHQLLAEVASQAGDELSAKVHSQEADKIYKTLIKRERELSERAGIKLPILQKWQENIGKS